MTQQTLKFRHATVVDSEALVALIESAYRGEDSRAGWTTEADLLGGRRTGTDEVDACVDRPDSTILVAEYADAGDQLLACAHVTIEDDAAYFGMFSVRPGLQGSGVGKALLAEAERFAREQWHCSTMRMTVIDVRTELIAFYERRGYRRTGIKKPFPYGDERFGEPKRPDLRFEVMEKAL